MKKRLLGSIVIVLAAAMAVAQSDKATQPDKSPKVVDVPAFTVIGIECHDSNAKEMAGQGCIGQQWMRLFQEGLLDKIPSRADQNIMTVYTDYSSDHGEYTFILGSKVADDAKAPDGMVKRKIEKGKFAVFTSDRGALQEVVPALWKRIWAMQKSELGGERAFQADFEVYGESAMDPNNGQMEAYIGIH